LDLNLFEYDYDLTFMVFFLNAEEKVYARYGGRDAENPDKRQSLEGLRYTMKSVLQMHEREEKSFAPKSGDEPKYIRNLSSSIRGGRCLHCHQVKEVLNDDLRKKGKWTRETAWRYPLPENLGFELEVDRGNVVKEIKENSAAAVAGLKAGDVVQRLNGVPIHSFGDAQYALDTAPKSGEIDIAWQRGDKVLKEKLSLADGWRKSDISWRPSMEKLVPSARLSGADLTAEEKKELGLSEKQLAFRQRNAVHSQAKNAGVQGGDIILGLDDKPLEMEFAQFLRYVERNYLVGDKVTINLIRDGKRKNLDMTLGR
jgi:predicted metalloprotease with PDZ domain